MINEKEESASWSNDQLEAFYKLKMDLIALCSHPEVAEEFKQIILEELLNG